MEEKLYKGVIRITYEAPILIRASSEEEANAILCDVSDDVEPRDFRMTISSIEIVGEEDQSGYSQYMAYGPDHKIHKYQV